MKTKKRQHSAQFKTKVVLEVLRGGETTAALAAKHEVHPTQINKWRKQFLDALPAVFGQQVERKEREDSALRDRLYQQIGELQVENGWLKKKLGL